MTNKGMIAAICVALTGVSFTSFADRLDGPLTDPKVQSVQTNKPAMPAPKATRFVYAPGGAPTADAGSALPSQSRLPPVVDVTGGKTLQPATSSPQQVIATAPQASVLAANQQLSAAAPTAPTSLSASQQSDQQRLAQLAQQMKNLTQMNMPQQISDLQTQLQQLRGQMAVQEHDQKLLGEQLKAFYQDLDQRVKKIGGSGSDAPTSTPSKVSPSTNIQLQDSNAYKLAIDQLVKRQYDQAKKSLQDYLQQYPNGQYKDGAHYWLGEIYLLDKSYKQAMQEFKTVITDDPKSSKVPNAKLKIGLIYLQTGKPVQARKEFESITKEKAYLNTSAAQLARIQLKQMNP